MFRHSMNELCRASIFIDRRIDLHKRQTCRGKSHVQYSVLKDDSLPRNTNPKELVAPVTVNGGETVIQNFGGFEVETREATA